MMLWQSGCNHGVLGTEVSWIQQVAGSSVSSHVCKHCIKTHSEDIHVFLAFSIQVSIYMNRQCQTHEAMWLWSPRT